MKKVIHFIKCHFGYHDWNMYGICKWCRYDRTKYRGGK